MKNIIILLPTKHLINRAIITQQKPTEKENLNKPHLCWLELLHKKKKTLKRKKIYY